MPRKRRKPTPPPDPDFAARMLFWGYSVLWDMEPGFNPTAPTQAGFSAFPYFGA